MKRIFEIVFIYLVGVIFLLTLALRVREVDKISVSDTSIASNTTIDITNYE